MSSSQSAAKKFSNCFEAPFFLRPRVLGIANDRRLTRNARSALTESQAQSKRLRCWEKALCRIRQISHDFASDLVCAPCFNTHGHCAAVQPSHQQAFAETHTTAIAAPVIDSAGSRLLNALPTTRRCEWIGEEGSAVSRSLE